MALMVCVSVAADDAASARQALDAAGVRRGLCLVLGAGRAGSPGLAAEIIAASDGLLVHALALDDASVARARKAVEAKGLSGRAMVEKLSVTPPIDSAQGLRLPYLNDLANLVIIEDMDALARSGLTQAEVERVVAPLGVICTLKGGVWSKTVKPRPKGMDEWTHPYHGADGNIVSTDSVFRAPYCVRWTGGFPMNITGFAANRGWVMAGGRCYTYGINETENLFFRPERGGYEQYLAARDAWNGLPLWKISLGQRDEGVGIMYENAAALAADGTRVYAARGDKAIAVDGASGKIAVTYDTKYPVGRLALADGLLVTANWEKRVRPKDNWVWHPDVAAGNIQAFDAATGAAKWSTPLVAFQMFIADGVVYLLEPKGVPPTEQAVVALDLTTGKERWRVPHTAFGPEADLVLTVAGKGFVVFSKPKDKLTVVLSAADGRKLWETKGGSNWTPVVEGLLWIGSKRDPLTGADKGAMPTWIGSHSCQARTLIGARYELSIYGVKELSGIDGAKPVGYAHGPARPSCVEGLVPANGMLYTSQNNCKCMPSALYGFLALGPEPGAPSVEDFARARPVEKGVAFGALGEMSNADNDWPSWRHDAERSGATKAALPGALKLLWKTQAVKKVEGPVAEAWKDRLESVVTAPVVAKGVVYAAASDAGQVVALDGATGKELWRTTLGSRIDTPPTVEGALCLAGCHDGWVYALRATDGALAWRARVAPAERRTPAFGLIESSWPVVGAVLVKGGVVYATAGRSTETEGGIALVALDIATGATKWAGVIGPGALRVNDALAWRDGEVGWRYMRFSPATGGRTFPEVLPTSKDYGGGAGLLEGAMIDGSWTITGNRKAGNAYRIGKFPANLAVWNDEIAVSQAVAYSRKDYSELWKVPFGRATPVDAMALAGNALVVAGHRRSRAGEMPAGWLSVLSLADGKRAAEFDLDVMPTYDGLAIANGRVYVSLRDGSIACFGAAE